MAKSARTGDKTPSTTGENRGRRKPARARTEPDAQAPDSTPPAGEHAGVLVAGGNGDARRSRTPTREQIAERAYEIYRSRGGGHGFDLDDWLQAERELLGR